MLTSYRSRLLTSHCSRLLVCTILALTYLLRISIAKTSTRHLSSRVMESSTKRILILFHVTFPIFSILISLILCDVEVLLMFEKH